MRPFQLRSKSFFIAFTFLFFLFSDMYPHTERMNFVPQQHKSLTPFALASMNVPDAKNPSLESEFQIETSKILEARILLLEQRVNIYRLKLLYEMLLRIQKEQFQIEEDLRKQIGKENPLDGDIHAWVERISPLNKNRGDKGLIYHS